MFFVRKRVCFLVLALGCALTLWGCGGSTRDYEGEIDRLKRENVALDAQARQLQEEVERLRLTRLDSWQLEAWGSTQEDPATIRFSARPVAHEADQRAELLVLLEGQEVLRMPCTWDGEAFSASPTLTPADGYGYYCVLTAPEGTVERLPLSTPEEPRAPKLTFLFSSLRLEASAVLKEIRLDRNDLTVDVAAAVQTPLLTRDGEPVTVNQAELQWFLDGELLDTAPVDLSPGQTQGSFSGIAAGICLDVPKMEEGSTLELTFRAAFSDGRERSTPVGSWTMTQRELIATVG